jgi:hypothetical protein
MDRALYTPSPWSSKFHQTTCHEVLGGGSAGPGKSLTLLWDPLCTQAVVEHARVTGQLLDEFPPWLADLCRQYPIRAGESEGHALHMRRTMPQLRENIDRSMRMFPKFDAGAVYSKEYHRWTFSSGYKFTFGHCREENSHEDYLSNQYTHLGFDEGYQFTERQYEELGGRVRAADPVLAQLLRTRIMSNPAPGWLKERFVSPCKEGNTVLKVKVRDPLTGELEMRTRLFLPARLDDNPDKAFVKQYKFNLLSRPAHMRARYLYGDWDSMEGGFFEDDWNPSVHVIEPFKIPRDWPKFRSMDWGYKAPGCIGWFAMDPDENLYMFYEFTFRQMRDSEVAERCIEIEKKFGFWNHRERKSRLTGVADTQLWEERGDSGKSKAAVFAEKGVYWQPADKASLARNAERISERLRDYDKHSQPGLMLFSRDTRKTQEMFAGIGIDENDNTVPDKKSPLKHWFDTVAYATARASRGRGSIVMDMHEFDRYAANDNDGDEPVQKASGFGYGM